MFTLEVSALSSPSNLYSTCYKSFPSYTWILGTHDCHRRHHENPPKQGTSATWDIPWRHFIYLIYSNPKISFLCLVPPFFLTVWIGPFHIAKIFLFYSFHIVQLFLPRCLVFPFFFESVYKTRRLKINIKELCVGFWGEPVVILRINTSATTTTAQWTLAGSHTLLSRSLVRGIVFDGWMAFIRSSSYS